MTPFNQTDIEAAAKAMKAAMGKQLNATPLPGGPIMADDWAASGGSINFTELFEIGLTAALASAKARGAIRDTQLIVTGKTWEAFTNYGDPTDINSIIIRMEE